MDEYVIAYVNENANYFEILYYNCDEKQKERMLEALKKRSEMKILAIFKKVTNNDI